MARFVRSLRAVIAAVATAVVATGLLVPAAAAVAAPVAPTVLAAAAGRMLDPYAREVVRPGDADTDPYHIKHVFELQWRLKRVGLFPDHPTGYFGTSTARAVKAFKRRIGLPVGDVMGQKAWTALIKRSTRGRAMVPDQCRNLGWHACYDRQHHQVTLFHNGAVLNSWLVRGGEYSTQTRTGDFVVYLRDIDHVSSLYDDAPMPYSQFFSGGQALHGSRFMVDPYEGHSHGCVNFYVKDARQLWNLTYDKRLHVHVYGPWA